MSLEIIKYSTYCRWSDKYRYKPVATIIKKKLYKVNSWNELFKILMFTYCFKKENMALVEADVNISHSDFNGAMLIRDNVEESGIYTKFAPSYYFKVFYHQDLNCKLIKKIIEYSGKKDLEVYIARYSTVDDIDSIKAAQEALAEDLQESRKLRVVSSKHLIAHINGKVLSDREKFYKYIEREFDRKTLIGDIRIDDEGENHLKSYMMQNIQKVAYSSGHITHPKVFAFGLVRVALNHYSTKTFWPYLRDEYGVKISANHQRVINEKFKEIMVNSGKVYDTQSNNSIQNICMHAFVCNKCADQFFDYMFDFWRVDLDRSIENIQDDNGNDLFDIMVDEIGDRVQDVMIHTAMALKSNPGGCKNRLRRLLKMIDNSYWHDASYSESKNRIIVLFEEWKKKPNSSYSKDLKKTASSRRRGRGEKLLSKPTLVYTDKMEFRIVLPKQILRYCSEQEHPIWVVNSKEKEFSIEPTLMQGKASIYTVETSVQISRDQLFDEFEIILKSEERQYYRRLISADNIRFFNSKNREINIIDDYISQDVTSIMVRKNDTLQYLNGAFTDKNDSESEFDVYFLAPTVGDILILPNEHALSVGKPLVEGIINNHIVSGAYVEFNENDYCITTKPDKLFFKAPKNKLNGTALKITKHGEQQHFGRVVDNKYSEFRLDESLKDIYGYTDGVFITLGKHKDLSLTRQTRKYVGDNVYRYFEACTCKQCHTLYLLGGIESEDGVKCLKQKANYSVDNIREAFYIGDVVSDDDEDSKLEDEHLVVTQYELCPHCGFIREKNQVHKTKCSHSEAEYISVTKVKQSELTGRVTKCVKCEGTNTMGILRPFFSGQEASTSVVGTALFEELPSAEVHSVSTSVDDSGFDFDDGFDVLEEKHYEKKAKQFIAFSDNRQAAAYFATYFYETYQSFLYSRVIYKGIKSIDESGRSLSNFVKDITADFRNNHISELFDDSPDYSREAWKAIMKELIQSNSRNSLMGLGLMKLEFSDEVTMPANSKYNLSSEEVSSMCQVLLRSMLEDNAIIMPYNFVESDIVFYSNNGSEKVYKLTSEDKYVRSFVPKTDSTTNKRIDYLQRVFSQKGIDIDRGELTRFLQVIWERLLVGQNIVIDRQDHAGKQVNLSKLSVSNSSRWYRCPKCHRITAYNVADVCPAYKCDGGLETVDIFELEKENHYYRIYNDLDIQPLRVVEHTAQLNSEEAYRLQEKFKNQEIDVLSCSTTFEMGVDIGDLETVFMRNMPPTPSNYIQRAGRAGRSTKSAALALTFCNKSNHDFSYFKDPVSMINGKIQPPLFKVENEKIGIRHLYSAALSFFWRERSNFFGQVKDFFGDEEPGDGYSAFCDYLEGHPVELMDYLLRAMPKALIQKYEVKSFGWSKWLFDEPNSTYPNLKTVYEIYRAEVDSLYKEKTKLEADNKSNYSIIRRINTYTKENVISFLSRNNILPKYGFPVDSVELNVASDKDSKTLPIELSRDLGMAISEYAPGCEVVAAGSLIRSRYIKRVPSKSWRQYDYALCDNCNTISIALHLDSEENQSLERCEHCGNAFSYRDIGTFIIPEFGFVSEKIIGKPSLIKPERTYRTEASIVAEGNTTYKGQYTIGNLTVDAVTMEDGEIAILNKSDFYVCPMCGYALSEHEAKSYSQTHTKDHQNTSGYRCKNEILRKFSLGYRFKTDVLHLSIDDNYLYDEAYSIMQAIILSACKTLNLDNNEISGCLQYRFNESGPTYDFMLYDTTPGGAGHVRRIANESNLSQVFAEAYYRAKNCDCGGEEGDASCYRCLRTYQNQQYHDLIKRMYVFGRLKGVID